MSLHATACQIVLNGKSYDIEPGTTLEMLLDRLCIPPTSVATAVGERFVPRNQRANCTLHDGDRITCFQPIVGG